MEVLYKTKLSTDIINIIIKYNDFSIENIIKKLSKYSNDPIKSAFKLKSDITIDDILMKCILDGNVGFFIHTAYKSLIKEFDKLMEKRENKREKIIIIEFESCKWYYLNLQLYHKVCDILKFHELFDLV
jgi:hypothetical protein